MNSPLIVGRSNYVMSTQPTTAIHPTLLCRASRLRDQGKGRVVSFSPKIFLPLTRLCRDLCSYCVFRQSPGSGTSLFMSPEEVLAVAQKGEKSGCREALLVLGERPEERYLEARRWLKQYGYDSTLEYLHTICRLLIKETSLYPHSNAGTLTRLELQALKDVNVSLGLMLEGTSSRLSGPGGPHERAPSKRPQARLRTLQIAGELNIPMTTGLLIGIGETSQERRKDLHLIRKLHQRYGHIQEVIIQNFRAKPGTPMKGAPELSTEEALETVAQARIILGPHMNIQVPPNLSFSLGDPRYLEFLDAGINDWGGISPVTIDYVNPEAPWPHLSQMHREMQQKKFQLKARFPIYPEYIREKSNYLPITLRKRLGADADPQGFLPQADIQWLLEDRQ